MHAPRDLNAAATPGATPGAAATPGATPGAAATPGATPGATLNAAHATPDAAAAQLAAQQHGCLASWQLADVGLSRTQARGRRQRGAWTPVRPGVDLVGGAPATPQRMVMEAVLAMGPRAVASHATALWLHGLRADAPQQVHVTVDGATRRGLDGVTVHSSRELITADRCRVDGIPATTVARTLIDLAAHLPELTLVELVDEILVSRRVTAPQLRDAVARLRRGRAGVGLLSEHLADDAAARFRSRLERRAAASWAQRGLPQPQWNVRVRDGHGVVWRVDAIFVPWPVVVELDGLRWHADAQAFTRDRQMDRGLRARGLTVLRFTWRDVMDAPDQVADEIASVIGAAMATGRRLDELARPSG